MSETGKLTNLLRNHVDYILNSAVWYERRCTCINKSQVLHAVHSKTRVDDTLFDVPAQSLCSARMKSRLASFRDSQIHPSSEALSIGQEPTSSLILKTWGMMGCPRKF